MKFKVNLKLALRLLFTDGFSGSRVITAPDAPLLYCDMCCDVCSLLCPQLSAPARVSPPLAPVSGAFFRL